MKRFTGLLNRTKSSSSNDFLDASRAPVDSPEANAARSIRLFCETAGTASSQDEEVLHLPVIVEAAESSPAAASAAAQQIRRFLSKEFSGKPHIQYNAIMLIRILADHPGPSFTRNFDPAFVKTVKECLRNCRDGGTQQILRETLDNVEVNKGPYDEGVAALVAMWRKEKGSQGSLDHSRSGHRRAQTNGQSRDMPAMSGGQQGMMVDQQHSHGQRAISRHQLPPPYELSSRIEEARNTAKILLQLIQSTPPEETISNELLREFSERCQAAQKSMQIYINCDSPAPDDDTMLTLIETNEQLSLASSRYQRAILSARRALGTNASPNPEAMNDGYGAFTSPPAPGQAESLFAMAPTPRRESNGFGSQTNDANGHRGSDAQNSLGYMSSNEAYSAPSGPPPQRRASGPLLQDPTMEQTGSQEVSNPFLDPVEHTANPAPLAFEPTNYGPAIPSRKPIHQPPISPPISPAPSSPQTLGALPSQQSISRPYHTGATPSYLGRQSSAANGLTMHGAQSQDDVAEIDGHSTIGRSDTISTRFTGTGSENSGSYTVSPVEARGSGRGEGLMGNRRVSRVDVAGTGGLRGA